MQKLIWQHRKIGDWATILRTASFDISNILSRKFLGPPFNIDMIYMVVLRSQPFAYKGIENIACQYVSLLQQTRIAARTASVSPLFLSLCSNVGSEKQEFGRRYLLICTPRISPVLVKEDRLLQAGHSRTELLLLARMSIYALLCSVFC